MRKFCRYELLVEKVRNGSKFKYFIDQDISNNIYFGEIIFGGASFCFFTRYFLKMKTFFDRGKYFPFCTLKQGGTSFKNWQFGNHICWWKVPSNCLPRPQEKWFPNPKVFFDKYIPNTFFYRGSLMKSVWYE